MFLLDAEAPAELYNDSLLKEPEVLLVLGAMVVVLVVVFAIINKKK